MTRQPESGSARIGWLDLSCGVSGDMLLGSLVDAGVALELLAEAVGSLRLPVRLHAETVTRAGLRALHVTVDTGGNEAGATRTWGSIRDLLIGAPLKPSVRAGAVRAFAALADAEAGVHGVAPDDVVFHELGGLDALADVVGVCAGFDALGLAELTASRVALGGGTTGTGGHAADPPTPGGTDPETGRHAAQTSGRQTAQAVGRHASQAASQTAGRHTSQETGRHAAHAMSRHAVLPVPAPAVLALLRAAGAPAAGGPVDVELCTPTGAALVTSLASGYGLLPPVVVDAVGTGAGSRDLPGRPNVVRLVVGSAGDDPAEAAILLETNVDDLDPRAWPSVLAALLGAGASDAWITPILMKKGRPAHTLSVLTPADQLALVRRTMYEQTTTLGIREVTVAKHALRRDSVTVEVDGQEIRVKTGELPDGSRVNAMPEWEDVVRAARLLNRPVKSVLAAAQGWAAALPRRHQD
jgi:uncharacterized protein (DUF111 family)